MAKITDMIEGYVDMTAEEKLAALEALEQPNDNEEIKKWKNAFDKASHEAAEHKKANKALQDKINSQLSEEELAKAQREQELADIIAERDALKRESAINATKAQYIGLGYTEELAESTANALYDNDLDTVLKNQKTFTESFEQTVRTQIVKGNPKPDRSGGVPPKMTKQEIMAIKDTAKRQALIEQNLELFE